MQLMQGAGMKSSHLERWATRKPLHVGSIDLRRHGIHLETLEHRLLFAAAIVNEKLTVDGTAGADTITLNTVGTQIDLNINGVDSLFNSNDVKTIVVNGLDMADTIAVNV